MKTVVITGSARGFGLAMLKEFYQKGYHVVLCDISNTALEKAKKELEQIKGSGSIFSYVIDVTNAKDIQKMIKDLQTKVKRIDVWINNAGVNQPNLPIWQLDEETINRLIDIDLKGTILCTKYIMPVMIKQNSGQIFNVEGHGSNDAKILGLSLYGTTKRAITYFTESLAYETNLLHPKILIGKITPGIMITNFIETALGDGPKITLDEKTKKVYNILGDYPETIAKFMVDKISKNQKNNVKFTWLTNRKAAYRFLTSRFHPRNFFE